MMDEGLEAGDEGDMELTGDARTLWDAALALDRGAGRVSVKAFAQAGSLPPRPLPPMLFFTDPQRTPSPWLTVGGIPSGSGVVYRHFGAPDAVSVAERLRETTRRRGVSLLIGLDVGLAERVGADGVHLPERALDQAEACRTRHPDWLLTGAVHDPQARRDPNAIAALDGLVLSPIFQAGGSSGAKTPLGPGSIWALAAMTGRPVYALGGVDAETVKALSDSGARGFASVEAIQAAFGQTAAD